MRCYEASLVHLAPLNVVRPTPELLEVLLVCPTNTSLACEHSAAYLLPLFTASANLASAGLWSPSILSIPALSTMNSEYTRISSSSVVHFR